MQKLVTPASMAAADAAAVDAGVASRELMGRAGRALGRAALQMMDGGYGRRVVIVCGKGNNGGDGFVCAAHLAHHGASCTVVPTAEPAALGGDAAWAFSLLGSTSCRVRGYEPDVLRRMLARADLVVDAMVGTGFSGTLRGRLAEAVEVVGASGVPVLAVDIPSGVDGLTGQVAGPAIKAQATVTMAALKPGLVLQPGAEHAGRVLVVDIGIPPELVETRVHMVGDSDLAEQLIPRALSAHKRSVGKVVIAAGSVGMTGAATLSALGAMRAGAGLVRVAVPRSVRSQVAPTVVEALTSGVDEGDDGQFGAAAAGTVGDWANQWDALALGPGIGRSPEVRRFVEAVLTKVSVPVALDADGLAAFAGRPQWLANRSGPTILTPHAGELGALLSMGAGEVDSNRVEVAVQAAQTTGSTVLLKGFRTVVAEPSGRAVLVDAGGPMLATAGTGDVLTGMVAALAAQMPPFEAAWSAACLHGLAGELVCRKIGENAVIAGDLSWAIGQVMRRLQQ
ncbi:MAG: NAD(P)H-hydrate dehydratase [Actinomycetota bacterium]